MAINVRAACAADVDFLVAMNRMVHDLHLAAEPASFRAPDSAAVAELFRLRLENPTTGVWIAEGDAGPIGYAVAVRRERPQSAITPAQRYDEIEELGVSPESRRQGVARALVARVVDEARAHGIGDVQLMSWCFNVEAHAAFAALGFRPFIVRFRHDGG